MAQTNARRKALDYLSKPQLSGGVLAVGLDGGLF